MAVDNYGVSRFERFLVVVGIAATFCMSLATLIALRLGDSRVLMENGRAMMSPITASLILILSTVFAILHFRPESRRIRIGTSVISLSVLVYALSSAIRTLVWPNSHWTFEFQFVSLFTTDVNTNQHVYMAVSTSSVIIIAALALLPFCMNKSANSNCRRVTAILTFLAALLCGASAISVVTGIPLFFSSGTLPMYQLTAMTLTILCFSLSCASGLKLHIKDLIFGSPEADVEISPEETSRMHWILRGVATILFLILALGTVYLRSEISSKRAELDAKLSTVSEFKSGQIADWYRDRISDALILSRMPLFTLNGKSTVNSVSNAQIKTYLESVRAFYDYECVAMFDLDMKPSLEISNDSSLVRSVPKNLLQMALTQKNVVGGELFREGDSAIFMDIASPVFAADSNVIVAVIVLRLDATHFIYPKLAKMPFPSSTGESIVFKREGNDVLYLSPLRHRPDAPLNFRLSLDRRTLPTSKFLLEHQENVVEGLDYRNQPVLAVSRNIPGTSWALLTKIDTTEAYAEAVVEAHLLSGGIALIMGLASMVVVALARQRKQQLLRHKLQQERLRSESDQRLALVMRHANDGIILADQDRRVVEVNSRAAAMYGYTTDEMLKLRAHDLRAPETLATLDLTLKSIEQSDGHLFETTGRRKDGSTFPVEVSSRTVDITGRKYLLSIVRDISERKAYEWQLQRMNRMYAALSQVNESIVHTSNRAELNQRVCRILVQSGGFKIAAIGCPNSKGVLVPVAQFGDENDYLSKLYVGKSDADVVKGPSRTAFSSGLPCIANDFMTDPRTTAWRDEAQKVGIRDSVALPLSKHGNTIGVLSIYAGETNFFGDHEMALLLEVASDLSFAYEVLERDDQRKTAEAALAASENRLRFLLSATPVVIYTAKLDNFHTTFISENISAILGYLPTDILNSPTFWQDNIHPDDRVAAVEKCSKVVTDGKAVATYRFRDSSGHYLWIQDELRLIKASDGTPKEIAGCWFDVTERKQAEEDLQFRKELSIETVRQAVDSISLIDAITHRFVEFNDSTHMDLGYSRQEFTQLTLEDIVDQSPPNEHLVAMRSKQILDDGRVSFDARHVTKTGEIRIVHVHARALTLRDKKYFACLWTDITDRLKTEAEMRKLSSVIEQAPVSIVMTDLDGKIEYVNPYFTALTGYSLGEARGQNPRILKSGKTPSAAYANMWQTLKNGNVWRGELCNQKKNGQLYVELAVIAPVMGTDNKITHYVAIKEDISERKNAEAALADERNLLAQRVADRTSELSRINAELGQAVRAKDEFLANMSHELRTPLNAILALSESLLEQLRGPLNERQQQSMWNIESSGRHLLSLINDILDLSKIEAGRMELHLEKIQLSDVCEASMIFVKELASKKNIHLDFKLNDALAKIEADSKRLKQILVNLLSNAVKFTESGGSVCLAVNVNPEGGVVQFTVSDTGIGIALQNQSKLFQPFLQLDSSLSRQHEGTGLGLALVRRLTELHNGSVAIESELGKGSCFTISIPYLSAEYQTARSTHSTSGKPPTLPRSGEFPAVIVHPDWILLVEDNEMNIQITEEYLTESGFLVAVARNGEEALQRAEEMHPKLILMDIQMPVMDGLEATRRLRANPAFAKTPIIALTALAMFGDKERCLAAGANDYLTKPVSLHDLVQKIKSMVKAN